LSHNYEWLSIAFVTALQIPFDFRSWSELDSAAGWRRES
jgi:hypothetical protein